MKRLRGAGLMATAWLLLMCVPANAHALLRSSQPADGALLNASPKAIVLDFTETPEPELSSVQVLDTSGTALPSGKPQPIAGKPSSLQVSVNHLPRGVYTVTWRVVSKVDGHVTAGSFSFGVGVAPSSSPSHSRAVLPTTPNPPILSVAGRWALYWGLALLLAGAVSHELLLHDGFRSGPGFGLSWLVAAVGVSVMALSERSTIGVGLGQFLRSPTGRNLAEQAGAILVCGVGVLVALLGRRGLGYRLVGLAALVALWFHALGSHADLHMTWFNVPVQFIHIAAVGIWVGGLVWLVVWLRAAPAVQRVSGVRRFSRLAGIALGLVVVTGTLRALDELGGAGRWRDLFSTSFGITLLVKIGLFVALVALAARNRYVNVPRYGNDPVRSRSLSTTAAGEIVMVAMILAATAVLSQLPPPVDIANAAATAKPPSNVVVTGHDFATSVRVRLTITPGTPGPNSFEAKVVDFDTGRPIPASNVTLAFSVPSRPGVGGSSLTLKRSSPSTWIGKGTNLSLAGRWVITATIQESTTAVDVPLSLHTRNLPEHITAQRVSGQPTIYTIALPTGGKLQTYIDPGHAGINNVHFTFFAPDGSEEAIASARVTATDPQGKRRPVKLIRFDKGHFVANITLSAGGWGFEVHARTKAGVPLSGHFSQQIHS